MAKGAKKKLTQDQVLVASLRQAEKIIGLSTYLVDRCEIDSNGKVRLDLYVFHMLAEAVLGPKDYRVQAFTKLLNLRRRKCP